MIIDYTSKPPLPDHQVGGSHLDGYDRVYAKSYRSAGRDKGVGEASLADYLGTYDSLGVSRVVIKARDAETTHGYRVTNEAVAEFCRRHSPRFIGLAGVDPNKGMRAIRELEHAVKELGLHGLNLHPYEHQIPISDPKMYPLYAKCIELEIPLNLHCSTSFSTSAAMDCGHPRHLDQVMMHFPELRVCAAPPGWPWVLDLIGVAWRHENVFIGITAVRPKYLTVEHSGFGPLLQYGRTVLQDRIIWGSAWPMQPVDSALREIEALGLGEPVKRKWLHENAANFLNLPAQRAVDHE
ncbi:MAG: amidohydrolase family protein [Alcaligenaceae bacterium]|nr:amidohydrolase family protein [Alcaligenaceae bacterium]